MDRNKTPEQLKNIHEANIKAAETQADEINKKVGKKVLYLVPSAQASFALRAKIHNKEMPGLTSQAELFRDAIGHPAAPLEALNTYLHFAVIYGKSPVGLPMPSLLKNAKKEAWDNKFNQTLQEIAWETVTHYSYSGVKAAPAKAIPAPSNIRGQEYPRIHADLRVTFRIKAPDAQKVVFGFFDSQRYPAKKGEDGFWTATTEPQVPGFHYYRVFIDGAEVNDPASETFYGTGKDDQRDRDPGEGRRLLSPQGRAARRGPRALVLLQDDPGSGGASSSTPRPVTTPIATRGIRCCTCSTAAARTRRGWPNQGRVAFILDNLIAERKARPMIVVMEQGYARRPGEAAPSPGRRRGRPRPGRIPPAPRLQPDVQRVRGRDGQGPDPDDRRDLSHDPGPRAPGDGRALHGRHADVPDHAQASRPVRLHRRLQRRRAAASAASPFDPKTAHDGVMADADEFNKKVRLLWLGIGTAEPKRMYESVKNYHEALEKAGIKHVYYESPGTSHEWLTWRRCLHEFAPLLFASASDRPAGPAGEAAAAHRAEPRRRARVPRPARRDSTTSARTCRTGGWR